MKILQQIKRASVTLALLAALAGPLASTGVQAQVAQAQAAAAETSRSSAAIRARDLDAATRWYRDNLGFRVISERSAVQGRSVVLERRGMLLEIAEGEAPVTKSAAPTQDVETTASTTQPILSLLVGDVDGEIERLAERDVTIMVEPDDDFDGRFRTAWVRDPDGRVLELREPLGGDAGETP